MQRYLQTLTAELADGGVSAPINIMGSNGGAMTIDAAAAPILIVIQPRVRLGRIGLRAPGIGQAIGAARRL